MKRRQRRKNWKRQLEHDAGRKLVLDELRTWPFFSSYNKQHGITRSERMRIIETRPDINHLFSPYCLQQFYAQQESAYYKLLVAKNRQNSSPENA